MEDGDDRSGRKIKKGGYESQQNALYADMELSMKNLIKVKNKQC